MDVLLELENMAQNVMSGEDIDCGEENQVTESVVIRWQQLFGYDHSDAIARIQEHRSNFIKEQVSGEHWNLVRSIKEAAGYDREAYEHDEIEMSKTRSRTLVAGRSRPCVSEASARSIYILKLEGPFDTATKVQEAANLASAPPIAIGTGELGEARFVTIDTTARDALLIWLSGKDLSATSMYPKLGVETTLPQYRADHIDTRFLPTQNQYPVWYCFYGNLAVSEILPRRLVLTETLVITPATLQGNEIANKKWRTKYNALVDFGGGDGITVVAGWAYIIQTEEQEEALRLYETENYEIVRCSIRVEGRADVVEGLTFKFVGPAEDLS